MTTLFLHEQALVLDNGIAGETQRVDSANPATFSAAISGALGSPQDIYTQTFVPPGIDAPSIVMIVPGSLGIAPSHVYKAQLLTEAGFAACLVDPFGARKVESTVANQAQFSFAASAWDVLAVGAALHAQGRFSRLGLQGHSRGGSAIQLATAMQKFTAFKVPFAGVYAAYPWCGLQFLSPDVGATRVRSIIGDQDEWCSAQQVQGYTHSLVISGCAASCRIIAGAHHSFDRDTPLENVPDASVAPGAPTVFIDDDGTYLHPVAGRTPADTSERALMLYGIKAGYGVRGAHIGSREDDAELFHEDMILFWREVFA
ncbi:MAG: hypothetical protein AAF513_07540 [Pseudomonadota bacterium]